MVQTCKTSNLHLTPTNFFSSVNSSIHIKHAFFHPHCKVADGTSTHYYCCEYF